MAMFNSKLCQITNWKSTRNAGFNIKNHLFQYLQIVYLPLPSPIHHQLTHPKASASTELQWLRVAEVRRDEFQGAVHLSRPGEKTHGRMDGFFPPKAGWWWLEHGFYFSHILGISIPIDFHIVQRGWDHQPGRDGGKNPNDMMLIDGLDCRWFFMIHPMN